MKFLYTILLLFFVQIIYSQSIFLDVNIFHGGALERVEFSSISGKYIAEADGANRFEIIRGNKILLVSDNDSVQVFKDNKEIGKFSYITFYGVGFLNAFSLNPLKQGVKIPEYDDNFKVSTENDKLFLINNVELEHYVAGVVQSEGGGSSKNIQFYFVQAITCRTYALVNYQKHKDDGYNLCDGVHCQYYGGRCKNADIMRAVARTAGDVIVDDKNKMISAAFHSNCGGQTMNSEDLWTIKTSYLRSVEDTFCTSMPNAKWEVVITKDKFLKTLQTKYNFPIEDDSLVQLAFNFKQDDRAKYFVNNVPLKNMRNDFHLKSTFFETSTKGQNVIFTGRGYGHGVGLCQEGAIRMVDLGYDYTEIISHYYKNTRVVHYSTLNYNYLPKNTPPLQKP